ncbi:hypothetical protein I316_03299 [Kwoniella heveanensis BCC8398]|uniref:Putative phospholipase n=1 Tax=Kwoniella heveanensis BCC8398 TaxID=1296120 RepID=A0A1B9GUP5_9TREE|nr:hypothetical protein I316_03299 [Kwoniella heveanensis BCC8398]
MSDSTTQRQAPGSTPQAPKVSSTYTHSKLGTIWSRQMPEYSGSYPVGAMDVEFPIEPQTIGSFRHRKLANKQKKGTSSEENITTAGIEIDTVLFTLFYPCDLDQGQNRTQNEGGGKGTVWFPRPSSTVKGFMNMAGVENSLIRSLAYVGALTAVHGLKFPAHQRAPIRTPPSGKWPLIIFSHGVGCSRLMYTHICGELASRGYVVAAVEHRDGTGPSAKITSEDGQERDIDFLRWTDLDWPDRPEDQQPKDDNTLRHDQLKIRLVEMQSTLDVIAKLTTGAECAKSRLMASRTVDWSAWKGLVEVEEGSVCLAGHSFGGTAVIAAAADPRFSPSSIIALDPAVERIEPWSATIPCPLISINSEEFSHDQDYERLLRLCETVKGDKHVYVIAGSTHPSFSDVFLITPGFVGGWTGLSAPPYGVILITLKVLDTYFAKSPKAVMESLSTTSVDTMPAKPVGRPGDLIHQNLV